MSAIFNMISEAKQELEEIKQMISALTQRAASIEDKLAYLNTVASSTDDHK